MRGSPALAVRPPKGMCLIIPLLLLLTHNAIGTSEEKGTDAVVEEATCNQEDCLRCELDSGRCTKCLYVMMAATRVCRNTCPEGYTTSWADSKDYMGRICIEQQVLTLVNGRDITLIAGAAVGGAICVGMVIGALLYMKQRTKPVLDDNNSLPKKKHRMWKDKRPNTAEVTLHGPDREEFFSKLTPLRGEINNFVDILNETRNRFRGLGKPDSATDTKAKSYRAVVRDLSRIVSLMNRKDEHIKTVPQDWRRLLTWADRVLNRYKRQKQAKESGTINTIEPMSSCSLYQTRRQAQKERCRLVTQCKSLAQDLSQDADTDMASSWKSSSRSSSMVSLAPIIFEEEEDDHQEKSDKMKDLDDNEFMKNMEFMENTKNEENEFHSDEINEMNKPKNNKNKKLKNDASQHPPASFNVVNEGINSKILKEKNNNFIVEESNLNSITRLNNMINESYISSINISDSLMKYKNKEVEFFNSLKNPVFKPVEAPNNTELKLKSENKAKSEHKEEKGMMSKNKTKSEHILNAENKLNTKLKSNSEKNITNKGNKENRDPKPPVPPKPKNLMKSNKKQKIKYADTYTNVTRKSLPSHADPYRDDTIEQVHVMSSRSIDDTIEQVHVMSSRSIDDTNEISTREMKMANKKELSLSVPRIELTTNL